MAQILQFLTYEREKTTSYDDETTILRHERKKIKKEIENMFILRIFYYFIVSKDINYYL